jgi:predicted AlkP superfamily pyrophosphatase or phosphodiesterase
LGRLSDVLISALAAVQKQENPIGLAPVKSICVLLVDGLGFHNLVDAAGHARFLNAQKVQKSYCHFPSTTSTSLTSLATGKPPDETGFIGYNIFDRAVGRRMNLLSGWEDQESATAFQTLPTVSDRAAAKGIAFDVVSQATYQHTGLTAATMPAAAFHIADSLEARFTIAAELLSLDEPRVVYLYIPELDQTAHNYGVCSNRWLAGIELVDGLVRDFVSQLPRNTGLVVTSDHGVIDVAEHEKIYFDEIIPEEQVRFVGGDTRGLMVYLKNPEQRSQLMESLNTAVGNDCYLVSSDDLISAGYFRNLGQRPELVPDFWIIAKKNVALYHRAFARAKSLANIGHHGSFSEKEMAVPIIRFNC